MVDMRTFIISVLVVAMLGTAFAAFLVGLSDNYNVDVEPQFSSVYEDINSSIGTSRTLAEDIQEKTRQSEPSETSATLLVVKTSVESLKFVFTSVKTAINLIAAVATVIELPIWFVGTITAMLMITASFLVWSAIFRRKV